MTDTRWLAVGLACALLVGCAGGERPTLADVTAPPLACSSEGLPTGDLSAEGLDRAVSATRQAIIDAAAACDYAALVALAEPGPVDVVLDGMVAPVTTWEEREADGQPILRFVAGILTLRPADGGDDAPVTWPSATDWQFSDVAPADERRALIDVVGEDGIFGWSETGGYAGWRTTISRDGVWTSVRFGPEPDA